MAANVKISQLTQLNSVQETSSLPVVESGTTRRVNVFTLLASARANDWATYSTLTANIYDTYTLLLGSGGSNTEVIYANDWATYQAALANDGTTLLLAYQNDWSTYSTLAANDGATLLEARGNDWATYQAALANDWATYLNAQANDGATLLEARGNDYATYQAALANDYSTLVELRGNDYATYQAALANDYSTYLTLTANIYNTYSLLSANSSATTSNTAYVNYSGNGVQTVFQTIAPKPTNANNILVYIDGVVQRPSGDYTLTAGKDVQFTTAPFIGSNVNILQLGSGGSGGGNTTLAEKIYNFVGPITAGTGIVRWYPSSDITLIGAYLVASTPPNTGDLSVNVNIGGSSVGTVILTSGQYKSSLVTLNNLVLSTNYVTVDVNYSNNAADASLTLTYSI